MARSALLVVDMQMYFCQADHGLARFIESMTGPSTLDWYFEWLSGTVVPNISRLLHAARDRRDVVVFTEFGSRRPDGTDLPLWARRHNELAASVIGEPMYLPLADPASRVIAELAPSAGDVVLEKSTSGPLAGTDLVGQLRAADVDRVIVTGVATDVCVTGAARELADSDFDVLVVDDACGSPMQASHQAALAVAIPTFAQVVGTASLLDVGAHQ
jgi:nicotinamidase-related amidase